MKDSTVAKVLNAAAISEILGGRFREENGLYYATCPSCNGETLIVYDDSNGKTAFMCGRGCNDEAINAGIENAKNKRLKITPASEWSGIEIQPRRWLIPDWVPLHQTTMLNGDGGIGKTLLLQQLQACVATGTEFFGIEVRQGPTLCIYCEDETEELRRRQKDINNALGVRYDQLNGCHVVSRLGHDNLLMTFDSQGIGELTHFWLQMETTIKSIRPVLVGIDTAADTYGGNEIIRNQVRQFIQRALTALAVRYNCAVLLTAHPSQSGISSGSGYSGSTAWNNTVRSRMYLEWADEEMTTRVLTRKKANYAATGDTLEMIWQAGAFVPADDVNQVDRTDDCQRDFIALLEFCEKSGMVVSTSRKGNYAPKTMVDIGRSRKWSWTFKQYEDAMMSLLNDGKITCDPARTGRDKRLMVVEND